MSYGMKVGYGGCMFLLMDYRVERFCSNVCQVDLCFHFFIYFSYHSSVRMYRHKNKAWCKIGKRWIL